MAALKIVEPIAQRRLMMGDEEVLVLLEKPKRDSDGGDFLCLYSIAYGDTNRTSYAYGADAVQALQLAFRKIGVDLQYISKVEKKPISWLRDSEGDTGFPQ